MKVVFISDTHSQHRKVKLPEGDMLIHAGDVSIRGLEHEIKDFLEWFSEQQFQYKIFIAGNHDFFFEQKPAEYIVNLIPENIIYLNDNGVEIEGLKIWGSPIQPWFFDWAFQRRPGPDIQKHWDMIPADTDILITHGPPKNVLDLTVRNILAGCSGLLETVQVIKPQVHVFGHIHEAAGEHHKHGIHFINASLVDLKYNIVNDPVIVEF